MKHLLHDVKYDLPMPSRRLTGDVKLDDPGALKALAHPARLAVVDELYQGHERTSSELAELTGLSPSAMSYHLRALERWGIVQRGEAREDGRERPWRAAGRTLSLDPETISAAAADVVAATTLQHLRDEIRRWALVERDQGKTWREVAGISRAYFWLTEEEVTALQADLYAVMNKHTADRDAAHHPEGTRRVFCLFAIVPEPGANGT
jgi:DNA-binding transcriptional ArsR family regulator